MMFLDKPNYRNKTCRDLVERVNAPQEVPFVWRIDIDGLNIDYSFKTLVVKCYEAKQPFGLTTEEGQNTVYFFPGHGCAVWCDNGQVTLNTFQTPGQFQDCIKMALVAHRKFIPVRQLEGEQRYKEIMEQLKQI